MSVNEEKKMKLNESADFYNNESLSRKLEKKVSDKLKLSVNDEVNKNMVDNLNFSNDINVDKLLIERNLKSSDAPKWGEVSFRIKLTEMEYKELMKAKSKLVKI